MWNTTKKPPYSSPHIHACVEGEIERPPKSLSDCCSVYNTREIEATIGAAITVSKAITVKRKIAHWQWNSFFL